MFYRLFYNLKKPTKLRLYSDLITFVKDRPGHDYRYAMNNNKIYKKIGWYPKVSFEEGIIKTIDWYLKNKKWIKKITSKKNDD